MAFNDDSFIREVNDELRSDQMKGAWRRFGVYLISLAVIIVLGTAGMVFYRYWQSNRSSDMSDKFFAALTLADQKKTDEALAALDNIAKEGNGGYSALARMREASIKADKGDTAGALQIFQAIAKDTDIPQTLRDFAHLRAGWLLVDNGTYEQVSAEVEDMAAPSRPHRNSAREILGVAAYRAGNFAQARQWFQSIVDDAEAGGVANRARIMLDNINASGKAPAAQG